MFMFDGLFGVMFVLMFVLVFGIILFTIIREISAWNKNNHSPRLTVAATVVSKRENIRHCHRHNGADTSTTYTTTSTMYYVTFQFESGDRLELPVQGYDYGMLFEGDSGKLGFQGTRFLGFERM